MAIVFRALFAVLGIQTVNIPSLNVAVALSSSTLSGKAKIR
ncbi:MAG: hypothetical protein RLY73_1044 [Pseudomonadota bacterium]